MSNFKCFEMEDIAYKEWVEWSDHLDLVADSRANSWLPAYGYHTSQQEEFINGRNENLSSDSLSGQQQSLLLETIIEETSDDLRSESDRSGPTGWNSDSDADSVIHLPKHQEKLPEVRNDWRTTDFESDPPKRQRRRFLDRQTFSDDEEPQEVGESASLSSRSSSLIAFESLEKHCEDVFRTTATNDPFGQEIHPDPLRWKAFRPDSPVRGRQSFSSDEEASSSSDDTLHRSHSSHGSFRSSLTNDSRLRSYRSFDSLNLLENPAAIHYSMGELSQSQNALDEEKEKEMRQEFVARDKKLTATAADLSTVADSYESDYFIGKGLGLSFRRRQELASYHYKEVNNPQKNVDGAVAKEDVKTTFRGRKSYSADGLKTQLPAVAEDVKDMMTEGKHGKSEPCLSAPSKSQHSAENLSEDSGFGDHISVKSKGNVRNSTSSIQEDEDSSSPLESSSSYYSDYTGSEEGSIVSTEGREHSRSVSKTGSGLKIAQAKESEMRGCPTSKDDADVKYNPSRSQSHRHNCATDAAAATTAAVGTVRLKGENGELTSPVAFASTGGADARSGDDRPDHPPPVSGAHDDSNDGVLEDANVSEYRKGLIFEPCDEMNSNQIRKDGRQLMSLRLPAASTPNLFVSDEDYLFATPSATSSLSHVPLKSLDDDYDELRSQLLDLRKGQLSGSQNTKGVHFCPIVSEVSWKEVYSEDSSSSDTSDPSTDEMSNRSLEDICMQNDEEEYTEVEEKCIAEASPPPLAYGLGKEATETPAVDEANAEIPARVSAATDNKLETVNKKSASGIEAHGEKKPVPPTRNATPTAAGRMHASAGEERTAELSVSEEHLPNRVRVDDSLDHSREEAQTKMSPGKKSGKSRLGGFFERFSFRRLSNRMTSGGLGKKQREKEAAAAAQKQQQPQKQGRRGWEPTPEGDAAEDEIRIIPLHAPGDEEAALRMVLTPGVVSAKPPLPPCPPRMAAGGRKRPILSGAQSNRGKDVASSNMPGVGEIDSSDLPEPLITADDGDGEKIRIPKCEKPVTGLLETDLDTEITVQSAVRRPLGQSNVGNSKKARSLMNLGLGEASVLQASHQAQKSNLLQPVGHHRPHHGSVAGDDRAKSMEFLLDKENQASVLPPENELQKVGTERVMSEHQLRVQRSLQKLNIPDWYKNSAVAQTPQGFLLKRHGDSGREHQGWPGLGSKTTSLSSLGSGQSACARSPTSHVLSPSPTPHLLSRWSTSRLYSAGTSTSTSPCGSARSSFNYRQPYLGWRSQERLTRPRTPAERLAAGLLPQQKQMVFAHNNQASPNLSEVRTSIKEVTSAIVHYVSGVQENGSREGLRNYSPNPSPKWQSSPKGSTGRLCWLESSFVGSRPLDQPETPLTLTETTAVKTDGRTTQLYLDLKPQVEGSPRVNLQQVHENIPKRFDGTEEHHYEKAFDLRSKPSPGSTTLDDVLESLLGLPPTSRSPSPGPISVTSATASTPGRSRPALSLPDRQHQRHSCGDIQANVTGSASDGRRAGSHAEAGAGVRRKSEGNGEPIPLATEKKPAKQAGRPQNETGDPPRKELQPQMSLIDAVVKCRYSKCGKTATVLEAKRTFKTCHNCSHIYCSRECRRAHWERHKRTCLHSRVGALCRQVLATAKEDADTLRQLSLLARRGYLTHGRGVVKTFFSSPELAEKFVSRGYPEMGEPAFVRWSDLLPTEMGADLYAELMKLSKSYNPDTRFVLYVAVCVVSEVPTSGAVKWERQLVSRCCKMRLDKSLVPPKSDRSAAPPPLPPRRSSSDSLDITREMENPETLILTSLPGIAGQVPEQKVREISFTNIQRELRQRGVSLRRQFPEVYRKLCAYVEGGSERFTPVTIYPRDAISGKTFMCIIMPDSEPEKLELLPKDSARVQTVDVSSVPETG